ncbi:MAG: DUF1343 domain-containing protein [Bacteroidales bacterium]|nr:DUF1343 domain-containing protein [Bacteroidales bacterium]
MRKILILLTLALILSPSCRETRKDVVLGDERMEEYLPLFKGKRVAILSNQSGIVGDVVDGKPYRREINAETVDEPFLPFGSDRLGPHLLDVLLEKGVDVAAVFSPEHGFRGLADPGELVGDDRDAKTGVPVISLYKGGKMEISREVLDSFDILVADLQDVGLRYYTYYITLQDAMAICAENGKEVVVLDRPNPNGFYVEGDILEERYYSSIGSIPVPTVHGMTLGELALMMNGEGWLRDGLKCSLTVIPCLGYSHKTLYSLILPPSPNLKTMRSVYLYSTTCFFAGTIVSEGRGTQFPFEVYGHPDMTGQPFHFTPESIPGASRPRFMGKECHGKDLRPIPLDTLLSRGIDFVPVIDSYRNLGIGDAFFGIDDLGDHFELLTGTRRVREMIENAGEEESPAALSARIKDGWKDEVDAFKALRKKYLLYEE